MNSTPKTFSKTEIKEANKYFSEKLNLNRMDEDEKDLCDIKITMLEVGQDLNDLPNNRAPGSDGFSVEFYKFVWAEIKQLIFDSITFGIDKGEFSVDQKRGVLTLIPQNDKDIRKLKNGCLSARRRATRWVKLFPGGPAKSRGVTPIYLSAKFENTSSKQFVQNVLHEYDAADADADADIYIGWKHMSTILITVQ